MGVVTGLLLITWPARAQKFDPKKAGRPVRPEPEMTLLVQQFGKGDVVGEKWVRNYSETAPTSVRFRWSTTLGNVTMARWQVSTSDVDFSQPLAQGGLTVPSPGQARDFNLDFRNIAGSAQLPKTYWVRVVVTVAGGSERAVPPVRINFVEGETTRFTAAGLYPELFKPMPVYVDMYRFRIIKADEENDEEPYIIPVVLYLDGTTVDMLHRNTSTIRAQTAKRTDTQGNIPQYNGSVGSGDAIAVPDDVGYFESTILPINLDLADKNIGQILGFGADFTIDYTHLVKATTMIVLVMSMEEDATSLAAANAARDAFVSGIKSELENCLHEMSLADVVQLVRNGQNLQAVLTSDEGSACGYTASEEEGSVLDQMRAKLEAMAKSAARAEELDDAVNWLPGGSFVLANKAADHDDVVGLDFRMISYEQLMSASGPLDYTLDFHTSLGTDFMGAARKEIHYALDIKVGRCERVPGKPQCRPTYKPLLSR